MATNGNSNPQPGSQSHSNSGRSQISSSERRTGIDTPHNDRLLCPVEGCPEASVSSSKHFRTFISLKPHLDDHCIGQRIGAIPISFLTNNCYTQCSVCSKLVHRRFDGSHPRCKPRQRLDSLRTQNADNEQPHISQELPSLSDIHERFVPTIKNIPNQLRRMFAQCLTKALAKAVWSNSVSSWTELQMLAKATLCRPARGGKSHKSQQLNWTRGRLTRWLAGERAQLWSDIPQYKRPKLRQFSAESAKKQQQQRCIDLTGEGGLSQACNSLISKPPLGHTAEITSRLEAKHPAAPGPIDLQELGHPSSSLVPEIEVDVIEQCIRSFHRLSGGGPSGLRPIHLKNCLTTVHRDEVLERCCSLVNLMAKGDAPESIAPFLAGATLTALPKNDNDIRPVAVGEVWRRLTAKSLCNSYREQARLLFSPLQIGVVQPLGTEAGIETARQWCERNRNDLSAIFVKIDFKNAFNCVNRQAFLTQCRHQFPGLSRWSEWCYSQPTNLYFGNEIISSENGVQQGDPIGPLLFALAIQPLLQELNNGRTEDGLELVYSYLDDLSLAGEQKEVAGAFEHLRAAASEIGLCFNTSKCEVIPAAGCSAILNKDLFPADIKYIEDGNFELLGGPIGTSEYCNQHTQNRVEKASELLSALGELHDPQVALILLRHCASFGKLVYSLRVVPHHKHTIALKNFDNAVRDCVESFLSCSTTDTEWSLANLSTKMGGLGLRSVENHSSAAFLSSRIACRELCSRLDPKYVWDITMPTSDSHKALTDYNNRVDPSSKFQTTSESIPRQQTLSQAIDSRVLATLKEDFKQNTYFLAHLNLTTASGAGSWLHTIPSRALGTHVDPVLYKTMIQRWLRIPVFQSEHHCPFCDEVVGRFGDHCLTCSVGGDRTKRHNLIRNKVYHFSQSAGLNPELERTGLLQPRPILGSVQESGAERDNNAERRPADVYIPRWRRGTPAAFDLAVTSGLRRGMVKESAKDGTLAVKSYETKRGLIWILKPCAKMREYSLSL